ncbi:hypothetical protein DB31_5527 [Hyalangium minutum]|uniref:Uncharacterized protein n=1 Tax=Hyalangium minutum TaxID=394096 RepID=A0A085WS22_9BACT|nr:hypothetical protein DB31_5527 [Hyalangium minutum]
MRARGEPRAQQGGEGGSSNQHEQWRRTLCAEGVSRRLYTEPGGQDHGLRPESPRGAFIPVPPVQQQRPASLFTVPSTRPGRRHHNHCP